MITDLVSQGDGHKVVITLLEAVEKAPRPYFYGSLIGYLVAIITTVVVMLVFDHGQPALLYLVPACLLSVVINAVRLGEFKELWEFNEETLIKTEEEPKKVQ